jgi:hypothetical protein
MSIPEGQDTLGSYFMANGFRGGYFGIQVNSPSERWILFSVWDAQNGERTTLVRKGEGVVDNNFGGEGTGGQSYLVFNWKAGTTYRFITRASPTVMAPRCTRRGSTHRSWDAGASSPHGSGRPRSAIWPVTIPSSRTSRIPRAMRDAVFCTAISGHAIAAVYGAKSPRPG